MISLPSLDLKPSKTARLHYIILGSSSTQSMMIRPIWAQASKPIWAHLC
jgi:hypothetical protein